MSKMNQVSIACDEARSASLDGQARHVYHVKRKDGAGQTHIVFNANHFEAACEASGVSFFRWGSYRHGEEIDVAGLPLAMAAASGPVEPAPADDYDEIPY